MITGDFLLILGKLFTMNTQSGYEKLDIKQEDSPLITEIKSEPRVSLSILL